MLKQKLIVALLIACVSFSWAQAEEAPTPYLTDEEHAELITLLDESFDLLVGLVTGLTDEQWRFKQNADRWSVAECAEHIVRSERRLLDYALSALDGDIDKDWQERTKGKTDLLKQIMPNRQPAGQGGATAPMEIRPTENWSKGKTLSEYYKIRGVVRGYLEDLDQPVKNYTEEHPFPAFGWLSAYDWLIYVPLHTIRHSRQIIEVQEDPNYPKAKKNATAKN